MDEDRIARSARVGFAVAAIVAFVIVAVAIVTLLASDAGGWMKLLGVLGGLAVGSGFLLRLRLVAYPEETRPFDAWRESFRRSSE